jgi:hypothetical protein
VPVVELKFSRRTFVRKSASDSPGAASTVGCRLKAALDEEASTLATNDPQRVPSARRGISMPFRRCLKSVGLHREIRRFAGRI